MGYNFDEVINQANAVMSGSFSQDANQRYSILYPDIGRTTVKLLFCPQSNTLMRRVKRHTCSDDRTKVVCMRTFGENGVNDCPVCKILSDIKDARGIDLYKYVPKTRGICYAQYISSTKPNDRIQPNSIVLLMFPWTVYKFIQETIQTYSKQPEHLEKLIALNQGPAFIITRGNDNKYTMQVDAMNLYSTCNSEEEFKQLLESLPPLEDCVVHDPPTEEEVNNMNSFANELRQKFLMSEPAGIQTMAQIAQNPAMRSGQQPAYNQAYNQPPYGQPSQVANYSQPAQQANTYSTTAAQTNTYSVTASTASTNQNHPVCYGQQNNHDPNECLMCPSQIACIDETRKRSQTPTAENFPM